MSRLKASVVLATCNGGKFLREQLDSIASQSRLPDEIVITDDDSTDDTLDVARQFAKDAPVPVNVFANPARLGFNGNFERAASLATGEVILFCDQDDVWLPAHVERLVAPFEADPATALVVSNSTYVDINLNPTGATLWSAARFGAAACRRASTGWQFPGWARHRAIAGHGMAFRAKLRAVVLPFGHNWIYDQWVGLVATACGSLRIERESFTLHRQHARQSNGDRQTSLLDAARKTPRLNNDHFANEVAMWTELAGRLTAHREHLRDPRALEVIQHRIAFLRRRKDMRGGSGFTRLALATKELARGGYHRYGRGFLTFARDVRG
jgi:glycosyltransferase involved in cell wall biosynthesis